MDFQYMGQTTFKSLNKKKQAIFFLAASKGVYCGSADLFHAVRAAYGNRWRVPGRAGFQCDWRKLVLYHDAVHGFAGAETDGAGMIHEWEACGKHVSE